MENSESIKFKASQNKKILLLKKIKLEKFPQFSKNLKQFFWDTNKYFQNSYKDHYIIIGNKENKKAKTTLGNKRKVERKKSRKFVSVPIDTDDKEKIHSIESKASISHFDRKRGLSKNIKENCLKIGQKYINNLEIEDLFNAFKTIQKLNRKRSTNFAFPRDYIDKNSPILATKTSTNFGKLLYDKKFSTINKESKNNSDNEGGGGISSSKNISKNFSSKINNINNEYYQTNSAFISNNNLRDNINNDNNDSPSKNINNFCSISKMNLTNANININDNNPINLLDLNINLINKKSKTANNFYHSKNINEKSIISRNRLIKRQKQFLLDSKDEDNFESHKARKNYYAEILANQEKTLTKTTKDQLKKNNLYSLLLRKTHKSKENFLMENIDLYRVKNELKDKFTKLNSKLEPEHIYNWIKDLREESKIKSFDNSMNANYYNIRDPFNKIMYNSLNNKIIGKKNNIKYYKIVIDEANNINHNLEGLYIKGKNLLKIEYDQIKLLKNKKIINNNEMYLPSSDVEDILFTDKKYISKNIKNKNNDK